MKDSVADYLAKAREWGTSMNASDSFEANRIHDEIQALYKEIVTAGHQESLIRHVDDADDAVALFVAAHLRETDRQRAIPVYRRLLTSSLPFVALSAKYILKDLEA